MSSESDNKAEATRLASEQALYAASRESAAASAKTTKTSAPSAGVKQSESALKGLAKEYDKMEGITGYRAASTPKYRNANAFYLYFGKTDSGSFTQPRLVVQYYADDWLFVRRAWARADGSTVDIPQVTGRMGWERDNSGGMIWEWSDAALSASDIAAVRTIADGKDVTIRFEGRQYRTDKKLTAQQLRAMREVISAYEAATGRQWR